MINPPFLFIHTIRNQWGPQQERLRKISWHNKWKIYAIFCVSMHK